MSLINFDFLRARAVLLRYLFIHLSIYYAEDWTYFTVYLKITNMYLDHFLEKYNNQNLNDKALYL